MSRRNVKRVTYQDVDMVKNLIERCIQLYMSPKEVVNTLQENAKIEPAFTEIIWQRLNEENPEFFKAYYTRLAVKQQIEQYNTLLEKQKQLMDSKQTKVTDNPTCSNVDMSAHGDISSTSKPENSNSSPCMFGTDGNVVEATPNANNASTPPNTYDDFFSENFSFQDFSDIASLFSERSKRSYKEDRQQSES